jgi:phosphotransacetylase
MTALGEVGKRARERPHHVVIVGRTSDPITGLTSRLDDAGLGRTTVLGDEGVQPAEDPRARDIAALLRTRWPERVRDGIHALDLAAEPLMFGAGLLIAGEADLMLAGPSVPADEVEDAYRWILGADRAGRGLGAMRYIQATGDRLLTTVVPDTAGPVDAKGLGQLALAAANHRRRAVGDQVRVAFIVPPPAIDASHADAEMVRAEFRTVAPGIPASVEWAWAPEGDGAKDPRFRQRPNVLIFPDPVSGHLAHGLLREAAGSRLLGPLFADDRWAVAGFGDGARTEDIVAVATVAAAGLRGV